MKTGFNTYLKNIDMSETLASKVADLYDYFKRVGADDIEDIFATDLFTNEGQREYENIWFFSKTLLMEAHQFKTENSIDFVPLNNNIFRMELKFKDYDLKEATRESRLVINFEFGYGNRAAGSLKAASNNCDYLKTLYDKYLMTNMNIIARS